MAYFGLKMHLMYKCESLKLFKANLLSETIAYFYYLSTANNSDFYIIAPCVYPFRMQFSKNRPDDNITNCFITFQSCPEALGIVAHIAVRSEVHFLTCSIHYNLSGDNCSSVFNYRWNEPLMNTLMNSLLMNNIFVGKKFRANILNPNYTIWS